MSPDHHHQCLDCGDVWLCLSECLPLRLTLCAGCEEKRLAEGHSSPPRVIGLTGGAWSRAVAPRLMAEHAENLRRLLRRLGPR